MEKAAIYLRLSKEDLDKSEEEHSKSIENQKKILQEYAWRHGLEIYDYYADDDYSGLYYERPSFLRMLEDAQNHHFALILAKSQSRLSRNMEHSEYLLHNLLPALGIRFIGVVDGVDTGQKYGKKARQINALVNEWYSEDLSENIRAVYRRKMAEGEYLGAYAPYGYCKCAGDTHRLVIEEETANWVRQIYHWYVQGESIKAIRERLEKGKVPTPLSRRRNTSPQDYCWSESTIKKILSNATYTGMVVQGKSQRRSFKDKTLEYLPREQWVIIENMHEPIISRELYEQAAAIRKLKCRGVKK